MSQGTAVTVNNINLVSLSGDITGNTIDGYVSSISGPSPVIVTPNSLQWLSSVTSPTLTQVSSANPGQNLTIQAQGTGGPGTGGNLILASGSSLFGSAGNIIFQLGATTGLTLLSTGTLQFPAAATATINQATSTGAGNNLSITAQSAGGTGDNGGSLVLTSGASTTTGTSGNVTINTATPGGGGTAGNILFQVSGTTQAFVNGSGIGIGSTPGTSPTISSGSGVPSSIQPTGSLYLNTSGTNITGIYTRTTSWVPIATYTALTAPVTSTTNTNTVTVYNVDSTSGNDGVILHNHTGVTTYVMPAPTTGRQIIIRDITGAIETTNQTGGFITGSGSTSNVIFVVPHTTESFNGSSGYALSGSSFHFTNNSAVVTATSSLFLTELAPGMSVVPVGGTATTTTSYVILSIQSSTQFTLTANYTGTTSTTGTATMNSLAYYANWGTLTLTSDGTNWFATSNKPLRVYLTANGTFIPSPGCTAAYLVGCGGGGGGGGGSTNQAGGGGGGALQSTITANLTPNISTGYAVVIGSGGTGGAAAAGGNSGNPGNTTSFGTISYFYGASGGGSGNTSGQTTAGGLSFTSSGSTNIYSSSSNAGTGSNSIGSGSGIQNITICGSFAMGGAGTFAGATNISATNGTYSGGAGSSGSGGGGAGPQGSGAAGGNTSASGSSAAANTGAGGGGGGTQAAGTTGGNGGSGYLYVYTWM